MRTERSYAQLARANEHMAHVIADAMLECDTALANLEDPPNMDAAVAAVARARARLRGDALHDTGERRRRSDG